MDKRIYILGGLLFILLVALVLFLVTRTQESKPPTSSTITIWDSFDNEETFSEIFKEYQSENKDIEIKYVKKDPKNFEEESINAFAGGNGPDIWVIPNNWLPKHHDKLLPLEEKTLDEKHKKTNDEVYKNIFLPVAYQDNVIDGKVYGMPFFVDSLSLFYNSALISNKVQEYSKSHPDEDLEKIGNLLSSPPKTWQGLDEFIKYYGEGAIALGDGKKVERSADILTALMLQYGAKMTSDDKTSAMFHTSTDVFGDIPYPGTKAMQFYTSFTQKDSPRYTWTNKQNSYQAFVKNEVAMMVDWSQNLASIRKAAGDSINIEVTSFPQVKDTSNPVDVAYYQTWTVPKTSKNAQRAWDLINQMVTANLHAKYLAKTGLANSRKDEIEGSTDFIDVQNKIAQSWYNPDSTKIEGIFKAAVDQVLAGQNPQTVLDGASAQVTKLLEGLKQ